MRLDRRERVQFDPLMTSRWDRNVAQSERNRRRFGHSIYVLDRWFHMLLELGR